MTDPRTIAVLADCHIHPPKRSWPEAALAALKGVDLIIAVGDMGESVGLDSLQAIAPIFAVRGGDDQPDDPRRAETARVLAAGGLRIGCVFDPVKHGLAASAVPFERAAGFDAAEARLFGGPVDVLLCASTHVAAKSEVAGRLVVNPGSLTLPGDGEPGGSFALLTLGDGHCEARIVRA
jgi:putative phosphoesterase